jgi:uncharacterized protein
MPLLAFLLITRSGIVHPLSGMGWTVVAGALAGFVLGFLGAGGTVVALPILLFLVGFPPHLTLGTNAMGVFLIAAALFAVRARKRCLPIRHGIVFAVSGGPAIYLGARLGLIYPGSKLIYLLGFLLFAVAGWMVYLSFHQPTGSAEAWAASADPPRARSAVRVMPMAVTAFAIGLAAGFFGIGGGFMIVPGLMLVGGLELALAAAVSLLPIATFAGIVGVEYWIAGDLRPLWSALMLLAGVPGGAFGIWLSKRLSKVVMLRVFAAVLVVLGVYMAWPRFFGR